MLWSSFVPWCLALASSRLINMVHAVHWGLATFSRSYTRSPGPFRSTQVTSRPAGKVKTSEIRRNSEKPEPLT
ncbi:hypothetical protein Pmani_015735 [Petrolisthes manimaculis]|uniref:Secreted protein n=1 Tax=Petrolisthes manimaculis TaxID=1843537 RepID=A0AAE1U7E7_9EUCA|nr:hypothetical protein Pmani_015735 [Petrolisthes manimaculis]